MGQSSIPILNRNGYSMFWLSSWDNLHSYSTNLNEDDFIRNFFYFLVNDKYSSNFFFNKIKLNSFTSNNNIATLQNTSNKDISEFFYRFNKIPFYLSKVRILKYQGWVVMYFYIYNYSKKIIQTPKNIFVNFLKFSKKNDFFLLKQKSNFFFEF